MTPPRSASSYPTPLHTVSAATVATAFLTVGSLAQKKTHTHSGIVLSSCRHWWYCSGRCHYQTRPPLSEHGSTALMLVSVLVFATSEILICFLAAMCDGIPKIEHSSPIKKCWQKWDESQHNLFWVTSSGEKIEQERFQNLCFFLA